MTTHDELVLEARDYQRQMWNPKQKLTRNGDGSPRRNRRPKDSPWPKSVLAEMKRNDTRAAKAKARAKRRENEKS